jgi:bacillithiol biosynthesis cysteine-adding enzyme BshC
MIKFIDRQLYNTFYNDFISPKSSAHDFMKSPHQISWNDLTGTIDLSSPRYQNVRQILINQNKSLDSEKAKKYLNDLQNPDSVILITGQQLGLFASPLYTIFKIITTIKLADQLNSQDDRYKYIPVFWLETEDHDFQEINHVGIYDKSLQPVQQVYQGEDRGKVSLRHYNLESSITTFISDIKDLLLETEFSEELFQHLDDFYQPDRDWTSAIRLFLIHVFKSIGVLFFYPGDPAIKKVSVEFFTKLLGDGDTLSELFKNQSEKLISKGYHNQVKYIEGQTFIHIEQEENQREHLYKKDNHYYFKQLDIQYDHSEILSLIKENPDKISTTVVSRPLLQSWLLPVASYIAGPGEIAYWAQLSNMFKKLDLVMPAVYPRISATIIEPKINRLLGKYVPDIEKISQKRKLFIEKYIKEQSEQEDNNPIKNLNHHLENVSADIETYLKTVDPTLVDAGIKSMERIKQTLMNLENRTIKAKEHKDIQLTNHLQQIHSAFFPHEMPQERFQSFIYFLNKFGPEIIDRIYSELMVEDFRHQLLYL